MTDYDALLMPAAPGEAPIGIEKTGDPIFNTIFSALHVPALTLPLFTGPDGCPNRSPGRGQVAAGRATVQCRSCYSQRNRGRPLKPNKRGG